MILATTILAASASAAESSAGYAQMAQETWAAFECSALASAMDKHAEKERLFKFGYEQGNTFIAAYQAGKIERKDLNNGIPVGILHRLDGPTPDFLLGQIYESVRAEALRDVLIWGRLDESTQLAAAKFKSENCEAVGNGR